MIADRHGRPLVFSRSYAEVMKEALGLDMKPGIQPHKQLSDPAAVAKPVRMEDLGRVLSQVLSA
jgi:hypothetical protein